MVTSKNSFNSYNCSLHFLYSLCIRRHTTPLKIIIRGNQCVIITASAFPPKAEQIYKIYRFRETERRAGEKRKIHKIYKISLACEQENKYTAPFTLDSLTTMAQFSARLDSLANL